MNNEKLAENYIKINRAYFRIADHLVEVVYDKCMNLDQCLPSFMPFKAQPSYREKSVLSVELTSAYFPKDFGELKLLSEVSVPGEENKRFEESEDCYITSMGEDPLSSWKMVSTKDFQQTVIYMGIGQEQVSSKCAWFIMVAYGQAILSHKTILFHASVIEREGIGYAFLGKSGTGKSTHSRLWLEHIEGSQLLNDDNPAVRIYDNGDILIYGTPWSGKTPCYKNRVAKLGALVRLKQAAVNQFQFQQGKDALIALLPSGTAIRWNPILFGNMLGILEEIISNTLVGFLQCLPNKDAALLCYQEVNSKIFS